MSNTEPLTKEEIEVFLAEESNWRFEDDKLQASFTLQSFEEAISVINAIAAVASQMDHHPLLTNVYNQLKFSLCTHHAGDKVTMRDIDLAREISRIVRSQAQ